jgi:hypothetical protein
MGDELISPTVSYGHASRWRLDDGRSQVAHCLPPLQRVRAAPPSGGGPALRESHRSGYHGQ